MLKPAKKACFLKNLGVSMHLKFAAKKNFKKNAFFSNYSLTVGVNPDYIHKQRGRGAASGK